MFKQALQVVTAFGVLLACYAGYVHVFALTAGLLARPDRGSARFSPHMMSKTQKGAIELAIRAFGRGHWSTDEELQIRLYNGERGFWMYAKEYERLAEGRQVAFRPFALIWRSSDGTELKTLTSDQAVIDFEQPFNLAVKPGAGPLKVVHARVEGDVRIRDDKGTPLEPLDDLRIGPLTAVEYDDATLRITCDTDVIIEDRDLRLTGLGLLIQLRPREDGTAGGFNGAQTAYIYKNVHVVIRDVGPSGILPGAAQPAQKQGEKTPLDVRALGASRFDPERNNCAMRIDLPPPRVAVKVGPPAPQGPTVVQFDRDVEVLRGKTDLSPDQLNCDHLRLILTPAPKGGADKKPVEQSTAAATPPAEPGGGPLNDLALRDAHASGHNVRITSLAQGIKARCNELIHKKRLPAEPDLTYFRGDRASHLIVEKIDVAQDGPNKGKVETYTRIDTIDATIFDEGLGNDWARIVARGPGKVETRPGLDQPVKQTAVWNDALTIETEPGPPTRDKSGALVAYIRKKITLTDHPSFTEHAPSQASLKARSTLVVWLAPKEKAPDAAATKTTAATTPVSQSFDLEKLVALDDVHLDTPGKILTARDRLDAVFEPSPRLVAPKPSTVAAGPVAPAPAASPSPTAAPAPTSPAPPAAPADPDARAIANRVWAKVLLTHGAADAAPNATRGADQRAEIDTAYLRGAVSFHQDPAQGKTRGTDVTGEAVDLINQGNGPYKFVVHQIYRDPKDPANAGLTNEQMRALDNLAPLARIENDELTILGQVIGLDQKTDEAWVDGRGKLTQMSARGLLSDKALPVAKVKPAGPEPLAAKKSPMSIAFTNGMKFHGRSAVGPDSASARAAYARMKLAGKSLKPEDWTAARAEFHKNVQVETEDSSIECRDLMWVYLDRPVQLARPKQAEKADADEPRADVALIECFEDVVVVNRKLDPAGTKEVIQKQRIEGDRLVYDRLTGRFRVPGDGEVFLYEREDKENAAKPTGAVDAPPRRPIVPIADRVEAAPKSKTKAKTKTKAQPPAKKAPAPTALPPLVLTQIKFGREMIGRFGTGKETDKTETRWADFFGDVEAFRARVLTATAILDPDRLPADSQFMTAQIMRVVSEPSLASAEAPPRYFLKAWENAYASTEDRTIQADEITYDSKEDKFFAYGRDGRNLVIAQQRQIGQGSSILEGKAAYYNLKTGAAELIDPSRIALLDQKTGARPKPGGPPGEEKLTPQLPKRAQFRNPRMNLERKDFNGH